MDRSILNHLAANIVLGLAFINEIKDINQNFQKRLPLTKGEP